MSVKSNFTESQNGIKDLVLENEELTQDIIGRLYQKFESFTKEHEPKTGTYQYQYFIMPKNTCLCYLVFIIP